MKKIVDIRKSNREIDFVPSFDHFAGEFDIDGNIYYFCAPTKFEHVCKVVVASHVYDDWYRQRGFMHPKLFVEVHYSHYNAQKLPRFFTDATEKTDYWYQRDMLL